MHKLFAILAVVASFAATAHAANIAVLPVGLSLAAGHDRAAITVTNQGTEPVVMQVETVSWTQADGKDSYVPTRDLLVNPPLFAMQPGRAQILRVGLRRPPAGERELAYRLFLREVPPPAPPTSGEPTNGGTHIRVLLELRLPVYVAPAKTVTAQQWHMRRSANGGVEVEMANTGNVHQVIAELKLRVADAAADSPPLAVVKTSASVFPGQNQSWPLPPKTVMPGQRYSLEVTTDRGTRNVVLDLDRD